MFLNKLNFLDKKNKLEALRSYELDNIKLNYFENLKNVKSNINLISNKSKGLKIRVNNFFNKIESLGSNNKILEYTKEYLDLIKECLTKTDNFKFEHITEENNNNKILINVEKMPLENIKNNSNNNINNNNISSVINNSINNTHISSLESNSNIVNKINSHNINDIKTIDNNIKSNINNVNNLDIRKNSIVNSFGSQCLSESINKNNEYFIQINPKSSQELIVYYDNKFEIINLRLDCFENKDKSFNCYPSNCKTANLGCSMFISGGLASNILKKEKTNYCYMILIYKDISGKLNQQIYNYKSMIHERERHNLLYIPNKNFIIAASGFFSNSVEITDLQNGIWSIMPSLNETRANATMCCINNKYVYIIGGYKAIDKQGMYLNNAEFIDIENLTCSNNISIFNNLFWQIIDFDILGYKLCYSAMGVIKLSEEKIILCGGLEIKYEDQCSEIEFNSITGVINNIKLRTSKLPANFIFLNNAFCRHENYLVNYELTNNNMVIYDPKLNEFSTKKFNN